MKKKAKPVSAPCPCGNPLPYEACCAIWHRHYEQAQGQPPDATAEGLMRSRYTAYVMGLESYLLATWAPQTRPESASANSPGLKWLGLRVVTSHTDATGQQATVEFVARSRHDGKGQRHHEVSRFERIDGYWCYVDGDLL